MLLRDKVHLVPAGLENWHQQTSHAYVKFQKSKEKPLLTKYSTQYKVVRLPDRIVYLLGENSKRKVLADTNLDFDTIVPIMSPEVLTEPLVLINPYHASSKFLSNFQAFGKKVIVDSGGFQLLRGTADFVDPLTLVDFYNKNADICMPLDLPLPSDVEPYMFDSVTAMMRANDNLMLPKLAPGRVLALVSHGSNVKNRLKRIEGLGRTSDVVAIAGLNTLTGDKKFKTMTALSNGLAVIDLLKDSTKYFHFLGVTSTTWFILYSIMVGTGYIKRCGGDSVTHLMASIAGKYRYNLGSTSQGLDSISRYQKTALGTTCRCNVCRTITDQRLLLDVRTLEPHNLWNATQIKNLIADSVEDYLAGKITLKEVSDQWLRPASYPMLARAVDYLTTVIQKGYREWRPMQTNKLFSTAEVAPKKPDNLGHYIKVIKRYEEYHGKKFLKT
jgi:queuine/archaeosine tRNA-ribosyltransferase